MKQAIKDFSAEHFKFLSIFILIWKKRCVDIEMGRDRVGKLLKFTFYLICLKSTLFWNKSDI